MVFTFVFFMASVLSYIYDYSTFLRSNLSRISRTLLFHYVINCWNVGIIYVVLFLALLLSSSTSSSLTRVVVQVFTTCECDMNRHNVNQWNEVVIQWLYTFDTNNMAASSFESLLWTRNLSRVYILMAKYTISVVKLCETCKSLYWKSVQIQYEGWLHRINESPPQSEANRSD